MTLTVTCAQVSLRVGDPEGNLRTTLQAIRDAADAGARVVVLPELANSGYVFHDAVEARTLAEPIHGPGAHTVDAWRSAASRLGVAVAAGLCERDPDGQVRNSAVLVGPDGELHAVHRKTHLWGREREFFVPGDNQPPVANLDGIGRIGLLVCYDLEFPEWTRAVALTGADLLCAPVNWPQFPRPDGERPAEVVRVQAAAAVNRMFVAACDRAGPERGTHWTGASVITDPDGFLLAGPLTGDTGTALLTARLDLDQARDKRIGDRNDVFADRRPELYTAVLAQHPPTEGNTTA